MVAICYISCNGARVVWFLCSIKKNEYVCQRPINVNVLIQYLASVRLVCFKYIPASCGCCCKSDNSLSG